MATHCSIFTWEIPWTEDPGGLQSMGSQRVKHDLATKQKQQYSMMENYLKIICTLYAYMYNNHFDVHLKLTQRCKSIIHQ